MDRSRSAYPGTIAPDSRGNAGTTAYAGLLLTAGLVLWVAVLRAPFFFTALGQDEGPYLYVADAMLRGERLYTDVWDNKPVGIFLIYSAIIKLLGYSEQAVRLAIAGAVLCSSWLLYLSGAM